jgi:hypothetical protein
MLRIKELYLENFRGYPKAVFEFGDFNFLVGPNGIGKTTALEAVNLLCASLDFGGQDRLTAYLRKNIRNIDDSETASPGFNIGGVFELDGKRIHVDMNEHGFCDEGGKGMTAESWWWMGICHFARFDQEMSNFVLPADLWPTFSKYYEMITGITLEPEVYDVSYDRKYESNLVESAPEEAGKQYVTGFWMKKMGSKVHSKRCSAGEKKIAKALSQIVLLPPERQPHIVLVDNLEMHVHYKRHAIMVQALKEIFKGKQLITTTHSVVLMDRNRDAQNASEIIDVEEIINGRAEERACDDPEGKSQA